ncbi:MAG: DUF1722 domain-containing protein [Pseudomonadales bacterium]|nr:DUF1722 domain-containing protein [Pseudomonadales bacterium]
MTLGISQCLLGEEVRYDGSGAKSSFPHAALAGLFEYRGICPEMGIGMGVPRAPIRLIEGAAGARAVGVQDPAADFTDRLQDFGARMVPGLRDVSGYVFMKNSPSCGLFRVKVYPHDGSGVTGAPEHRGRGIYAEAVVAGLPELPVEESGRLNDVVLRENFVTRVYAYAHWQRFLAAGLTAHGLIAFHSRYKYLLMAHSTVHYRDAGRLLGDLSVDLPGVAQRYVGILMAGLTIPATRKSHANVLSHLQGYLKRALDGPSRQELDGLVARYRTGELPLLAPITMLKHYFRLHPDEYIDYQVYLDPHPQAAALRRPL